MCNDVICRLPQRQSETLDGIKIKHGTYLLKFNRVIFGDFGRKPQHQVVTL